MVTSGRGKGRTTAVSTLPAAPADLFKLPLEDFTAARNALAGRLKKAGKTEDAERVRGLNKPPLPAWTVNQLFWRHRPAFETLLKAGDRFRTAQAAQLSGKRGDLRGTLEARLAALSTLSTLAVELLRGIGHPAGPDVVRRVTTTLEALAAYGTGSQGPQPGFLTADVDPSGFEALAALVPRAGGSSEPVGTPRVLPFRQAKTKVAPKKTKTGTDGARQEAERHARQSEARAALRTAERTVRQAQRGAERAEAALKHAAATARTADEARTELAARLEKATAAATSARQSARRVAAQAEEAAQALADAERALDAARQRVADLR